jgi:hypothetical protein
VTTTFRADLAPAIVAALDTFIAANPALLRRSEVAQPPSVMGDLPLAFVAGRPERVHFTSQVMERIMSVVVVVVWPMADNNETVTRADTLVDQLLDHFNGYTQFVSQSIWSDLTIEDEDYPVLSDDGTVRHFYSTRFTFVVSKMEGRP